ncbi:Ran-binding protein [Niveomyces insectorum RCEF 264]|uniref:Ran-binding protein n=1 Tax=Niveomyces insectorum RCEF 264 TaxID=1081102 RepID=A0A162I7I9_9HYPO|nr:Ran-binding protein [Niveomyces insectorum RCEF 264]
METPQTKPRSWLSSLTGLVSVGRSSTNETSSTENTGPNHASSKTSSDREAPSSSSLLVGSRATARTSGTFSAPFVESPESLARRASPGSLSQRKIHDRAQGPSGKLGSSTNGLFNNRKATSTNYLINSTVGPHSAMSRKPTSRPAATRRDIFRSSVPRETPIFTFTPRGAPKTMRGHFPLTTPDRPGFELNAREMAKVVSGDLFPMKIPDPDPELSGETVANMVPADLKSGHRSVYANEYLAHLCPPDFSEEQRNQFFCVLDLRRLKYAADEVFLKKDWKLNVLNFAKEYEKNRSLIMLRYGLYEFKTVKVSKDVFEKWKAANNVPDLHEEDAVDATFVNSVARGNSVNLKSSTTRSKPKGTGGILRTSKRKTRDDDASAFSTSSDSASNKRLRPLEDADRERLVEREPLTETSTPALNKTKRKATNGALVDSVRRNKLQKPTQNANLSATSSATKIFLEKVSNSPVSAATATSTPSVRKSNDLHSSSFPQSALLIPNLSGRIAKASNGSLARSVLDGGLKTNSMQSNNIFGYLSDGSSAQGGGNDNADVDVEDANESDGQAEVEEHEDGDGLDPNTRGSIPVTQPSAPLLSDKPTIASPKKTNCQSGSASSPDVSESTSGRSLFDRISKGSNGQPIRVFDNDGAVQPPVSLISNKPISQEANLENELAALPANKTWIPNSPIKFANGRGSLPIASFFGTPITPSSTITPSFKISDATPPALNLESFKAPPNGFRPAAEISMSDASQSTATTAPENVSKGTPPSIHTEGSTTVEDSSTHAASVSSNVPAASSFVPPLFSAGPASEQTAARSLFGKPQELTSSNFSSASAAIFSTNASTSQLPTSLGSVRPLEFPNPKEMGNGDEKPAIPKSHLFTNAGASPLGRAQGKTAQADDNPKVNNSPVENSPAISKAFEPSTSLFSFAAAKPNGQDAKERSKNDSIEFQGKSLLFGNGNLATLTTTSDSQSNTVFDKTNAVDLSSATASNLASERGNNTSFLAQPSTSLAAPVFGGNNAKSANSSFTFNAGSATFRNPFASDDSISSIQAPSSFSFAAGPSNVKSSDTGGPFFQFGASDVTASTPVPTTNGSPALFAFGLSQSSSQTQGNSLGLSKPSGLFGGTSSFSNSFESPAVNFSTAFSSQPEQQAPATTTSMFNLAPPLTGTSKGTDTPFTNAGASSLATTPATGTPEPGATQDAANNSGHQADGDEAPQEQIKLTEGGPGEEDEAVVYEVRAKALKLVLAKGGSDNEVPSLKEKKSPWRTEGVGPLRVLKHKATGAVRLLLRAEPRGHVVLNKALLPEFSYKPEPNAKYVKLTTANGFGSGLETWILQVKTKELAQRLADVLEEYKTAKRE